MQQVSTSGRIRIPWPQLNLLDVMLLVLVAGLSLGLARGARGVTLEINDRSTGAALMVLAVWLCAPLLRQALTSSREHGRTRTKIWPVAWRLSMVAGLAWLALREAAILRLGIDVSEWFPVQFPPVYRVPIEIRTSVLPILLGFALIGVACCLLPLKARAIHSRRGVPLRWLMIPLVAVVGLLIAAVYSFNAYLVLIAVDGVTSGLTSRSGQTLPDVLMRGTPSLNARLARTAWDVLASIMACIATGILVCRDLRRDLSAEPLSSRQFLLRMSMVIATVFLGLRLLLVTTPMMHPSYYEALFMVFERPDFAAFVATFSLFGVGLAARSVAPRRPSLVRARWWRWIGNAVGLLLIPILTLLAVSMYSVFVQPSELKTLPRVVAALEWIRAFHFQLAESSPLIAGLLGFLWLNTLCWVPALGWLMAMVVVLNVRKPNSVVAPLDQIGATRARLGWFVWCSTAVTAVCLAALPTFALGGIVVFHCRVHAYGIFGWKLP